MANTSNMYIKFCEVWNTVFLRFAHGQTDRLRQTYRSQYCLLLMQAKKNAKIISENVSEMIYFCVIWDMKP